MKILFRYYVILQLLIVLIASETSGSSKYLIHTYDQDSGMPNSYVTSITQDSNGIIWAITKRGLTSYDGIAWKQYLSPNSSKSKLDNIVYVKVDESKNLWVAQLDNSLRIFKFNDGKKQKSSEISIHVTDDRILTKSQFHLNSLNNDLTFAAIIPNHGIYVFANSKWHSFNQSNGITDLDFISVHTFGSAVYFSNTSGFYKIENGKISPDLTYHYFSKKHLVLAMNTVRNNSQNTLWILTDNQIGYIERNKFVPVVDNLNHKYNQREKYFSLIPNYFNSIVWGSAIEINTYNKSTGIRGELTDDNGLIDDGSSDMFLDREQILWISSFRGISKLSSCRFMNNSKQNGLLNSEVSAIIERSYKDYFFGHKNGITHFDGKKFHPILFNKEKSYERVNYFVKDKSGTVWASAYKSGIAKIDKNNKITWLDLSKYRLKEVSGLAADSNDRIFFSAENNVYEIIANKPKRIITGGNFIKHIRGLYIDRNNSMIITTALSGLFRYSNNNIEQFLAEDRNNFNANDVYSVYHDTDGTLYVGTQDGLYKAENGKLVRTGLNDKVLNRYIYFILKDNDKNFWFGTEMGLIRYNGIHYWNYGVSDGLAGLETNRGAGIIDSRHRILIGTNKGLSVYLKEYDVNRSVKPLVKLLNAEAEGKLHNLNQALQFTSNSLHFVVNFNVISFYDESKNSLIYKLDGEGESIDAEWQELKNIDQNFIQYKNLKPGTYTFKIRAKNALGVWSDEVASATIEIKAPADLESVAIIVLAVLFTTVMIFWWKSSQNKKYGLKLEKEVSLRTAQLSKSEKRYKQMFSENNAIMLIINPDNGNIIDANPSAIEYFDLNKEELLRKNIFEFKSTKQIDKDLAIKTINSSKEINLDYIKDNTQELRFLKVHLSEIESGERKLLYCIIDDTTDQVNAEKQLIEVNENLEAIVKNRTSELEEALDTLHQEISQRMEAEQGLINAKNELEKSLIREKELNHLKSRFILMVSHEYRTPLTVIFSSAELIKEFAKMGHIEACLDYAKRIQESVRTLTELLEGVMTVGEETEVKLFIEDFDYKEFLNYVINDINSKTKSSHNFVVEGIEDAVIVRQDRNVLKQIISQIVSNSVKFSEKGTDIIINNKFVKDKLIITIKDFGCGVSDSDIEQIFEPFYKCQDAVGIVSGTGLGLAIVKKNVQALGGKIFAESELKRGTSIFIELPIK